MAGQLDPSTGRIAGIFANLLTGFTGALFGSNESILLVVASIGKLSKEKSAPILRLRLNRTRPQVTKVAHNQQVLFRGIY